MTLAPEPTRAGVEGAAASVAAQTAPAVEAPVVETPADEEFGDSEEIDPAAAARAAARIAEYVSASEGILSAGTSEGGANIWLPRRSVREGTWAAVKPGIPLPSTAMNGRRPRPGRALIGPAATLSARSGRPPGVAPPDRECK